VSTGALDLVDRDRYTLDRPESTEYAAVVADGRDQLASRGAAILRGFLTPAAIEAALGATDVLVAAAHRSEIDNGSPYLELPDDHWPAGHPRLMSGHTALSATAYDRFPADDPIRRLYESDDVMALIGAVLDEPVLYRYDDSMGALNLAVMDADDELWWHFDQTDFVVSLALRSSERGGDFEYVPRIRTAEDERYDAVAALLSGNEVDVVNLPMEPGTLVLFQGRYSIHRVTPIEGDVARLVALLAYDTKPGTCSSELLRAFRYGRTA
jgi:hypothetical protein